MRLEEQLSRKQIFCKEDSTETGSRVTVERPVLSPENEHDTISNKRYFSEVLFEAFNLHSKVKLKYCMISMIHYLKRKEGMVTCEDYNNTELFFHNDPYFSWTVVYPKQDGELKAENIIYLRLRIKPGIENELAELLLRYFTHQSSNDCLLIDVPVEFIQFLVFEE